VRQLVRNLAVACGVSALLTLVVRPDRPRIELGVVGGGLLVALAVWAIGGLVEQVLVPRQNTQKAAISRGFVLVKFFTRHAILALAAYGMMLRLHLDPVGMLIGVSSIVAAVAMTARRR
jgi:hypothetical protein